MKRGFGGIREIEFAVQAFQLLHGGRDPWIREANTLRALHRLVERRYLSDEDCTTLVRAYVFLRTVEHRLQHRPPVVGAGDVPSRLKTS